MTSYRVFRTAWFSKAARKAAIRDHELCTAISQVAQGRCDDLGGGVFKKRLKKNDYRAIILVECDRFWVFEYLFAKSDRANIETDELVAFRKLSKVYEQLTDQQIAHLTRG
jgi:hypothetical protein